MYNHEYIQKNCPGYIKMKPFFILFLFLFLSTVCYAQISEVDSLVEAGIAFHDNGEFEKAIGVYQKALNIDANSSVVNYEMAFSYLSAGDYINAEKYSKKVIELDNSDLLGAYVTYGSALDLQGKTTESIAVYEKAMESYEHYLLYYNHAISCYNNGDIDKAYDSAIKALNNNFSHASSHLILSQIMAEKGNRIKAMLPLYFFLLIEPASPRAQMQYPVLRNYMDQGVTQKSDKDIETSIPVNSDPDFGTAEIMISINKPSSHLEENKDKTDLQVFAQSNESLFKILGELKKENTGFWWDYYVTFFNDLANAGLAETFSYYISQTQGMEVDTWFDEHNTDFERFKNWMNE